MLAHIPTKEWQGKTPEEILKKLGVERNIEIDKIKKGGKITISDDDYKDMLIVINPEEKNIIWFERCVFKFESGKLVEIL